ncbi:TPA: restriction endonuclease subunit S [Vibrio parahaemolyticus]|nr:restriction endonuclease subunit S [Vibrio parahaemolyticus]
MTQWKTAPLGEIITFQRGYDLPQRLRQNGEIPIISSAGVIDYHCKAMVDAPGVVTGRYGTIGELFFINEPFWPLNTTLFIRDFKGNDPKFIYYLLHQFDFQSFSGKSGVPGVNRNDLHEEIVSIPSSVVEQRAIAKVLSDVDGLITSLGELITKKKDLKQSAMQELLTGKNRLPEFEGEWRTVELGEIINHCSSGATPYRGRSEFYDGDVKWITSGELNYNVIYDTIEHISHEATIKTNLKIHPVGTFLMAITGLEAAGTRGACGIVGSPATTNQSCMAIYPSDELKVEYLYYYYVYRGNELAIKYCQGTKQQSYTAKLVKKLPIEIPPTVEEQGAIAAILSDMDSEIETLEQRRNKTLELKQGVMQELLTGKTRLDNKEIIDV